MVFNAFPTIAGVGLTEVLSLFMVLLVVDLVLIVVMPLYRDLRDRVRVQRPLHRAVRRDMVNHHASERPFGEGVGHTWPV